MKRKREEGNCWEGDEVASHKITAQGGDDEPWVEGE